MERDDSIYSISEAARSNSGFSPNIESVRGNNCRGKTKPTGPKSNRLSILTRAKNGRRHLGDRMFNPAKSSSKLKGKRKSKCRTVCKFLLKYPGFFLILAAYTYGGAHAFKYFERPQEEVKINDIHLKRLRLLESLWTLAVNSSDLPEVYAVSTTESASTALPDGVRYQRMKKEWVKTASAKIINFENFARNELQCSTLAEDGKQPPSWDIWGALFFCGTVYTTIGKSINSNTGA